MNDWAPPGATRELYTPKQKKKKKIVKGDMICTCGALDKVWTMLHFLHDKDCIVNTKDTK